MLGHKPSQHWHWQPGGEEGRRGGERGEGRQPANVTRTVQQSGIFPVTATVTLCGRAGISALFTQQWQPVLPGDIGHVSWARAHLADCQPEQVF